MMSTHRKRFARARQRETGDKYMTALRWVDEHFDELIEADYRRRLAARAATRGLPNEPTTAMPDALNAPRNTSSPTWNEMSFQPPRGSTSRPDRADALESGLQDPPSPDQAL